jgi:hypothetical protein
MQREQDPEAARAELARLHWLIVQTMNGLAEEILAQIQATRAMAAQTEALLTDVDDVTSDELGVEQRHLRLLSAQIEQAMQELPETAWDDFARTCVQLARTVARVQSPD